VRDEDNLCDRIDGEMRTAERRKRKSDEKRKNEKVS